jgi:hypothetical protein
LGSRARAVFALNLAVAPPSVLVVQWSSMRRHVVVLWSFVAAVVHADPARALQPDDLVGERHASDTTWERMNDYDLEAGVPKKVITTKNGSDDFVIVRRGRFSSSKRRLEPRLAMHCRSL